MEKRKLKKKQVQFQRKVSAVDFMTKKFLKRHRSSLLGGTPGSERKKEKKREQTI